MDRKTGLTAGFLFLLLLALVPLSAQQPCERWERIGEVPGSVSAIGVSPSYESETNPTLFVGFDSGGLWRVQRGTDDGCFVTFNWAQATGIGPEETVTAISFLPGYVAGTGGDVFAGTREGHVYRSTDDFQTATRLTDSEGLGLPVTALEAWIGPMPDEFLYAFIGTNAGVYRYIGSPFDEIREATEFTNKDCRGFERDGDTIYMLQNLGVSEGSVLSCNGATTSYYVTWMTISILFSMDPTSFEMNGTYAWVGTSSGAVHRTTDITAATPTWTEEDTTPGATRVLAACPAFAPPPGHDNIWAGTDQDLFISEDAATTFSNSWAVAGLEDLKVGAPVTAIGLSQGFHGSGTNYCDAFIGTESAFLFFNCDGRRLAPPPEGEEILSVFDVEMAAGPLPGAWAASSLGLYKNDEAEVMLQYNAFYGEIPDIVDIEPVPCYDPTAACDTTCATIFAASLSLGVLRSKDHGNSWTPLTSGWPSGAVVNTIEVSPDYSTDLTVFAGTFGSSSNGLLKWAGSSWDTLSTNYADNVTLIALCPDYLNDQTLVYFSVTGGLYWSTNGGTTAGFFEDGGSLFPMDVTGIAFSPTWDGDTDWFLFISRVDSGVWFCSQDFTQPFYHYWCQLGSGLSAEALTVRGLAASPQADGSYVYLLAATLEGPYRCQFNRSSDSDPMYCSSASYTWSLDGNWSSQGLSSVETLSVTYDLGSTGMYAAVGTAADGVWFSSDYGATFGTPGTGYHSLPDDIWSTVPSPRSDAILFASSPSHGVFVSTDWGESFWPWNETSGVLGDWCMEGVKGLGIARGRGCSEPDQDLIWAGAADPLMDNAGISVRPIDWQSAESTYDFDQYLWDTTDITTGSFEHFESSLPGETTPVWAASSDTAQGFFLNEECTGMTWSQQSSGLGAGAPTDVRFGFVEETALTSGVPTGSLSLGQDTWHMYTIETASPDETLEADCQVSGGDVDMYIRYGNQPSELAWDYFPGVVGTLDETVCVPTYLINEDFASGIPGTWTITDGGSGTAPPDEYTWNTSNPCSRSIGAPFSGTFAIVDSQCAGSGIVMDEMLETPVFSTEGYDTVILEFSNQFRARNANQIWVEVSIGGGAYQSVYTTTTDDGYGTPNTKELDISSLAANESNVQIRFSYGGTSGYWWAIDNVKVRTGNAPVDEGTWYIGILGVDSSSTYELTATIDGCALGKAAFAAPRTPRRKAPEPGRSLPKPKAPSASAAWGTVSGSGVYKGSLASTKSLPGTHSTYNWTLCNGTDWGILPNLAAQSILQLSSGNVLTGCNGNLYLGPSDELCATWMEVANCIAGTPSWNITDFLEASNGDVLVAMEGAYGSGGVWLSGNGGTCWMRISEGFDPDSQSLQDLANDSGGGGAVEYYGSTNGTGLYNRTVTPDPAPTVSSLSVSTGPASGGTSVTVTGSGFATGCITGNAADCPYADPVVWFGETPVQATYVSGTELTVTTPAHLAETVEISVMNPDTRTGTCACAFTFSDDGTGGTAGNSLRVTQDTGQNVLDWDYAGQVAVERSTSPQFDENLMSAPTTADTWTDPDPGVGTDGSTYYYRIR